MQQIYTSQCSHNGMLLQQGAGCVYTFTTIKIDTILILLKALGHCTLQKEGYLEGKRETAMLLPPRQCTCKPCQPVQ